MTDKQLHLYLRMLIARLRNVAIDIDELENPGVRLMTPIIGFDCETQESDDFMNAAALTLDDWLDEFEAEVKELLGD